MYEQNVMRIIWSYVLFGTLEFPAVTIRFCQQKSWITKEPDNCTVCKTAASQAASAQVCCREYPSEAAVAAARRREGEEENLALGAGVIVDR